MFVSPQAEEFQEVVQVMREFLPQAESELKYKTLPEDEMQIIQLIEKHEVSSLLSSYNSNFHSYMRVQNK